MVGQFEGKVVLVTGSGSGIGRATALAFGREGGSVVVSDVSAEGGRETVERIVAAGGAATFIAADVTNAAAVEALVRATVATYGRLDHAFNNAGISGDGAGAIHEHPIELWGQVLSVNLTGVFLCLRAEIQQMLVQGGDTIVNTASVLGLVGGGSAAYTAAKHGVVGLTKHAALRYAQRGIRVNAVCPGPIETPMIQAIRARLGERFDAGFIAATPMGRLGSPEEIAAAVLWLCSDAATFVTGVALPIDGGWVAH